MSCLIKLTVFGTLFLAGLCALLFVVFPSRAEPGPGGEGDLGDLGPCRHGHERGRANVPAADPAAGVMRPLSVTGLGGSPSAAMWAVTATEVSGMAASQYAASSGTDAAAAPGPALVRANVTGHVRIKVDGRCRRRPGWDQGAAS